MSIRIRKKTVRDTLNEMGFDKASYESRLSGVSMQLYHHLIFVCVLSDSLPEMVSHWRDEIYKFTNKSITTELKKDCRNINRVRIVEEQMMADQMGVDFEDYDVTQFIYALETEKKEAQKKLSKDSYKPLWVTYKKEIRCVDATLKDIDDYAAKSEYRIRKFYDMFRDAVRNRSLSDLNEAIDDFINF